MKIVTAAEMREIDRITSGKYGVPSLALMEHAGTAVAEFILLEYPDARRIRVVCGKGNNGGDGLVAARRLHEAGRQVQVLLLGEASELRGDAAQMYARLPLAATALRSEREVESQLARQLEQADLLVDAIVGTGFRPPAAGLVRVAIMAIRDAGVPVVAVDLPSGVDADSPALSQESVNPQAVVSFTAPKPVHVAGEGLGQVVIADIGSPAELLESFGETQAITAHDIAESVAPRAPGAHKGDFGHVLVIAGSLGKAGAAAMAGMGALRAGAGLVTVATPKSVLATVAGFAPELMTEPLAETEAGTVSLAALDYGRLESFARGKTVGAIGPGISRHPEAAQFVRAVVKKTGLPIVLDADGLNAFEGHADANHLDGSRRPLVLTPHPGEMARLTGLDAGSIAGRRRQVAADFARQHGAIVVLKGHPTVVAEPAGGIWLNTTGNPGMATGGTGDVLTGMIAATIARRLAGAPQEGAPECDLTRAVCAAVYLHGLAGDFARDRLGENSMLATDLLASLPEAFAQARRLIASRFAWVREAHRARFPRR